MNSSENGQQQVAGGGEGGYGSENKKKARLNSTLAALLDDPILSDVPKNPKFSDVDVLVNLELGSAMRLSVLKLDGTAFDVVVLNSATVKTLKLAVEKKVNEVEQTKMGHRHISWRHVWGNYCLSFHNEKLIDEGARLQDFGIRNNYQVQFVPFITSRFSQKHSKRRKHRFFHGLNKYQKVD
ncbi:U11/U12 small nuclear ribonucleoprotein [Dionaea muscipula]